MRHCVTARPDKGEKSRRAPLDDGTLARTSPALLAVCCSLLLRTAPAPIRLRYARSVIHCRHTSSVCAPPLDPQVGGEKAQEQDLWRSALFNPPLLLDGAYAEQLSWCSNARNERGK